MALTYRAPVEEVIARFTSEEQSTISSTAVKSVRDKEAENHQLFNFSMSALAKERLTKVGIYLSPYSFVPHSHPVCKTLENYMLYTVLPNYVNKSFFFVGIKDFKLSFLKIRNQSLNTVIAINRYVTSLDKSRYSNDFVCANSKTDSSIIRHKGLERSRTLRDLLPEVVKQKARNLFLHDELHYWSCNDLVYFLEECRPERLLATMVIPTEVLVGCSESLNPWAYKYKIEGSNMIFAPDGCWSEAYTQPVSSRYLLRAKRIYLGDNSFYNVDLVSTKFCHHLIAITKGDLVNQEHRHFSGFDAIGLKHLSKYSSSMRNCYPVRIDIVTKVYLYLRTLKKPDYQSAEAKLRQLVDEPNGREIKFIEDFAKLVIDTGPTATILNVSKFKRFIFNIMPHVIGSFTEFFNSRSIEGFIYDLDAFSFSIRTKDYDRSLIDQMDFETIHPEITDFDLPSIIDDKFSGGIKDIFSRVPAGYSGAPGCKALAWTKGFSLRDGMNTGVLEEIGVYYLMKCPTLEQGELLTLIVKSIKVKISFRELERIAGTQFLKNVASRVWRLRMEINRLRLGSYNGNRRWFLNPRRVNMKCLGWVDNCELALEASTIELYAQVVRELSFSAYLDKDECGLGETSNAKATQSKLADDSLAPIGSGSTNDYLLKKSRSSGVITEGINMVCASTAKEGSGAPTILLEGTDEPIDLVFEGDKGVMDSKLDNLEQLGLIKLTGDNWDRVLHNVQGLMGEGYNFVSIDLCGCFHNPNYLKNKKVIEELNVGLRGVQAISFDKLAIAKKGGLSKINELVTNNSGFCALICLKGIAEYHASNPFGEEVTTRKIKGSILSKECYGLYDLSSTGFIAVLIQTDRVRKGNWIAHEDSCFFSGATQQIYGCPVRLTRGNNVGDFNVFSVPGDGNCLWYSIGHLLGLDGLIVKEGLISRMVAIGLDPNAPELNGQLEENAYAEREAVSIFCATMNKQLIVITPEYDISWVFGEESWDFLGFLVLVDQHYQPAVPSNGCVIRAIAECLGRVETDVISVLCKGVHRFIFEDLCRGKGLNIANLEDTFKAFNIRAVCDMSGSIEEFNREGAVQGNFLIQDGHMEFVGSGKIKKVEPKIDALRTVSKSTLSILKQNGTIVKYKPEIARAKALQESLLEGRTGLISSEIFSGCQEVCLEGRFEENLEREVVVILGTFGSGKSWLYKEFISRSPGKNIIFVSPRRALADSIKDDLGLFDRDKGRKMSSVEVVTFEVFLKKVTNLKRGHTIVLDEIQLFPPGYIDFSFFLSPEGVNFVLAGDPCQSHYDNAKDRGQLGQYDIDIMHLLGDKEYRYNVESRRFKNLMFEGRLPCEFNIRKDGGEVIEKNYALISSLKELVREYPLGLEVILVSSFEEKKIINSYFGSKQKVLTFGESTGLNFSMGCVMVSAESRAADDRRWLTALSRFSVWIILANVTGVSHENLLRMFANRPLQHFMTQRSSSEVIRGFLPGRPLFFRGFQTHIGRDEGIVEDRVAGDPWLKCDLFLGQRLDIEPECEVEPLTPEERWFKCHLPLAEMEPVRARWAAKLALKEAREFRIMDATTEQFPDEHHSSGEVLTNACERYEAIYPRHKGTDSITFLMAVRKRLKFSRPDVESAKLRRARPYGKFLLGEFLRRIKVSSTHEPQLFEQCKAEFEEKKVSKSKAVIENHSGRSCRDWLSDVALIFMKSQHCTKFDNRFRDAKAGQTLACFHHSVLCRFAPFMRYIEKKVMSVLPKNYYIHSGKNIEDLDLFIKESSFSGVCTESDYEAFDASQDHYILAFEISLMEHLGLPVDLIEDYIFIKTHLGSKLGNFSIMRFTGEASTFLFNTLANMLFTFLRYELTGSECIAFAGDDMCANSRLRVSMRHEGFLSKLSLKAKVNFVENPTFCGWCLTADGVFKKPQLVWERICIARERNNIANCIDNYAIEVSYAYNLGELAVCRMTEEELENHYLCVRFIIRHKHLIKSSVALVFSS